MRRDSAEMILAGREGDQRISRLIRGNPYRLIALPSFRQNLLRECGKQVSRQRRLFESEGVVSVWNDNQGAIRNLNAQGFVQRAGSQKIELAVQDHRRNVY